DGNHADDAQVARQIMPVLFRDIKNNLRPIFGDSHFAAERSAKRPMECFVDAVGYQTGDARKLLIVVHDQIEGTIDPGFAPAPNNTLAKPALLLAITQPDLNRPFSLGQRMAFQHLIAGAFIAAQTLSRVVIE